MTKPSYAATLLFLDVDGPLIPFRSRVLSPLGDGNPLLERIDPEDGRRLLALGCTLVWATTWMGDANEVDDEITDADRRWVAAHYAGRALLHRVDPYAGLAGADFHAVRGWLSADRAVRG